MIVGERLRELRNKYKITAEELANTLDMSKQQVLRYETNKTDVTSDTLIKIADFFDVSTDYLLGRADHTTPYERKKPAVWNINLSKLLNVFSPEFVGRLVRASGFDVRIVELEKSGKRQICIDIPETHTSEQVDANQDLS